ncbi:3-methylcrotonyl-CoA carboxylase subunit alpha [Amylibacter ulvae]|uniref:3-methylcrotonyl-CoA carboxylase subunit alpha n=1 Tax=Paramylibacter ulvae TaxID=1651968 RepID=A0ABQ3D5C4_9RHOB|nr:acetyl/propionyl/methylcrotonyl-CoA carboxylase subunit alpha [Amylibacter ulvae]GHA51169.1 3-methylcrotonyl-CoA carboxylase subunit alpha [Amylibacter ulvae]
MFDKILIANRGEIACRVIETARRLGVQTVAVYSDADAHSKHVALADQAVHIGPPAVNESYLLGDRIIAAALKTGAQAIHPGYGFLSENPDFVDAVVAAGLKFIGPSADAIRAMGLKDAAKNLMQKSGVPVVPGYHGESQDLELLQSEAEKIGYPVLIKARAGGGGKGMRLVENAADFSAALDSAQREASASFGDPICMVEKYITSPRHIEIQVFGDEHGNVIHLFERDCSLQRRHQKVIEEAPAPDMPADVRAAMGQAAIDAAKAVNYVGAGTVEFIVDGGDGLRTDGFWFMEMNTRLQVEHPVSEAITGLDFVELQLRVAAGEELPVKQDDLRINGWSFEARVYAEDVPKGFLPSTGTLHHLQFPTGSQFALGSTRIDSGVRMGDAISPYYDPMIAKVIVHGPTRAAALGQLRAALADTHIAGSVTNIGFLSALAAHDGVGAGQVDTGLIARDIDALTDMGTAPAELIGFAAVASLGLLDGAQSHDPFAAKSGFRAWGVANPVAILLMGDDTLQCHVEILGHDQFKITQGDVESRLHIQAGQNGDFTLLHDGVTSIVSLYQGDNAISVFANAQTLHFTRPDPLLGSSDAADGGDGIIAPMPGLVKLLNAHAGQSVSKGDVLIMLEAMKMEHSLTAPRDGIIAEVLTDVGDQVLDGAMLLQLEPVDI